MTKHKAKCVKTGDIYNAVQWFRYGDHRSVGYLQTAYEKFYKKRKYGLFNVIKIKCPYCNKKYHGEHGVIRKYHDNMVEKSVVCPGDWIINNKIVKEKDFKIFFEIQT